MKQDDRRLFPDDTEVVERLRDMIGPLAAVRSLLEILRDHPEVPTAQRARYVRMALDDCRRLQTGLQDALGLVPATTARSDGKPGQSN